MVDEFNIIKSDDKETNLELEEFSLANKPQTETIDYEINASISELNVLNSPELKVKKKLKSSKNKMKNSGNLLADLVSPPTEQSNIIDRFMDFLDELIRRLVNGFVNYLEKNHQENFDFFMNLLFRRKKTIKKEDGSYKDEDLKQS